MNVGVGQTGSTCWFFSSLNIFLTSDNGLKILWQKLQETLPTLSERQRAYFNSNVNAPCPYKGSVKKTSAIYFWKFLNQYICAVGGPGRLLPTSGLNAYLTKNVKWRRNATRESKGTAGAFPSFELPAILGHLGFRVGRDFRMVNFERWQYKFKNNSWTAPILMYNGGGQTFKLRDLMLEKMGYDLTAAIVYVAPALESGLMPHVWACTIRNGKGYVTDSNFPTTQIECSWWLKDSLERRFMSVNRPYRTGVARVMGFDVVVYTRKEFTKKIAPTCLLPPGGYRPMTQSNRQKTAEFESWGPGATNFLLKGRVGNAQRMFTPLVIAEALKRSGKRPVANTAFYNSIVNKSTSFRNGLERVRTATKNGLAYTINTSGKNYMNFKRKLIAKFPRPFPKYMLVSFWKNSKSNTEFANKVRNAAMRSGYAVNENKLKGILATRAKTRAGVKRAEERVYKVGNNWYNNNATNVTNKINLANWVLNEAPNKEIENALASLVNYSGNVKTYRRR